MNKRLFSLLLVSVAAAPAAAQSSIDLYAHLSPVRAPNDNGGFHYVSPSFPDYQANVIAGLAGGGQAVGSGPAAFVPLTRTAYSAFETTGTPFNSWRGEVSPPGAYAGEFGTYLRVAARVVSSQRFSLDNVFVAATGSDYDYPAESLASLGIYTAGDLAGLSYGADGVAGGGDDSYYDASTFAAATQVNELYFVGSGQANGYYTAEETVALGGPSGVYADANAFFGAYAPYRVGVTFSLRQNDLELASNTFNGTVVAVPEPAAWALMFAGLGAMCFSLCMRRGPA